MMKLDIDFDKLLSDSLDGTSSAYESLRNQYPDMESSFEFCRKVSAISADTTIRILKQYHQQLVDALSRTEATD